MSSWRFLGGSLCSGLRTCSFDCIRRIRRLLIPKGSSSSSSPRVSFDNLDVVREVEFEGRSEPILGFVEILGLETSTRDLLRDHVFRDVADEDTGVFCAGFEVTLLDGVARSSSSSSDVSSSSLAENCLFFPDELSVRIGFRTFGELPKFDRYPAAALVVFTPAPPFEIHFASFLGLSNSPCKLVPFHGTSPSSAAPPLSLRCFRTRLALSWRRRERSVSGPTVGRSISRMVAAFWDLARDLSRLYSARCRCVVNWWAMLRNSSSTMR